MEKNTESIPPEIESAWVLASPGAVSIRLQEVFPSKSPKAIAEFVEPLIEISSETARRYINGAPMSHMFLIAVALLTGVRLEWLCSGRGAKTDELEQKRILDNQNLNDLIIELLSRADRGEIAFVSNQVASPQSVGADFDQQTDTQLHKLEIGIRPLTPRPQRTNLPQNPEA